MSKQKQLFVATTAGLFLLFSMIWGAGSYFIAPVPQHIGAAPENLQAQNLQIPRPNTTPIASWFIQGQADFPAIVLLHGIRGNRLQMLERAKFLKQAGYSVLLLDLQAHGETAGDAISFGYREGFDVRSAVAYLKQRLPNTPIGVIGVSLGGAAALLGDSPLDVDALVLEAVYRDIGSAIDNRMAKRVGGFAPMVAPLLLWQIEPRLGIATSQLSPLKAIANYHGAVFIIAGTKDLRTTLADTQALYQNANTPKQQWLIEGAAHTDFYQHQGKRYQEKVLAFFAQYLC